MHRLDDSRWRPLHGELRWGDWTVAVWSEPCLLGEMTADPFAVLDAGGRLRVAVADPAATNPDLTDVDVAWSAQVALGALRANATLHDGIADAAARLCDPTRRPRLANPLTAAAAVDLHDDGTVNAVRAGDCEVWVLDDAGWRPLFDTHRLTDDARAAFGAHHGADPASDAHWDAHVDCLDDPDAWRFPPLGFETPTRFEAGTTTAREVIVASDGAELTAQRCAQLTSWLNHGIQTRPHPSHPAPHGDIVVAHAGRRPPRGVLRHCANCGVRIEVDDGVWVNATGELCCERPEPR